MPFNRSLSNLPALKNGTCLLSIATEAPVFGFRPFRAFRSFTEKAPKPRNSTLSPEDGVETTDIAEEAGEETEAETEE